MLGRSSIVWLGSLLVHAGLALSVGAISPVQEAHAPTKITIREIKRPKAEPPAPPPAEVLAPPAPPPEVAAPAKPPRPPKPTAAAPAPVAAAAPSAPGPAVPSFGLTLSGGTGSGGIAVAAPSASQPTAAPASTRPPKALARAKPAADACSEALIKPKPLNMPQPVYARQAREANIAGKVRVELRVDALGQVASAKVLEGLGYGLDEAALEAARAARFEPATLCGRATETTFVIGMRFSL